MNSKIYDKKKRNIISLYKKYIIVLIVFLILFIPLPYFVYMPGGEINLNKRIDIKNGYDMEGSFNMAYVSTLKSDVFSAILSFIIPNWDLKSVNDITYDNETLKEMDIADKIDFENAIANAKIAAYEAAGKSITITNAKNMIVYRAKYTNKEIEVGDELITADNININNLNDLASIVETKELNEEITLKIKRNNELKEIKVTVQKDEGKKIGLAFTTVYEVESNPKIDIKMKKEESGPSGGLMMALTIYNRLTPFDLTKGLKIIGTGTIDENGVVGQIGGVKYKVLGAIKKKSDIFICPKENYEEAKSILDKNNSNMELIAVSTLSEAIYALS